MYVDLAVLAQAHISCTRFCLLNLVAMTRWGGGELAETTLADARAADELLEDLRRSEAVLMEIGDDPAMEMECVNEREAMARIEAMAERDAMT